MTRDPGELHRRTVVLDGLCSSTLTEGYLTETLPEAGVDGIHASIIRAGRDFEFTMDAIGDLKSMIGELDNVEHVTTAAGLSDAEGLGVLFGIQDTTPIARNTDRVALLKDVGISVVQLTYNHRNYAGNGCTERVDGGLSAFGRELITELERQEIVLDLSHAGHTTAMEAVTAASRPVILSHSNPAGVHPHPRNASDDLVEAVVGTGGTVGINAYPDFVAEDPSIEDLVDHVDYLADLVGTDHIALGLDFIDNRATEEPEKLDHLEANPNYSNPPYSYPDGIESAADVPNITAALLERGYSPAEVEDIMGKNLLRVYREVLD